MRRPTSLDIPAVSSIPASLVVRRANIEEAGALAELLGRAYPSEIWNKNGTKLELFVDESVKATLVAVDEGQLIATASLKVRSDIPEFGYVRWVATEIDWRRQGLAKVLVTELLGLAEKAGCLEIRLQTTTDLSGAIALYLTLGFEPLVSTDTEREIWQRLFKQLGHES